MLRANSTRTLWACCTTGAGGVGAAAAGDAGDAGVTVAAAATTTTTTTTDSAIVGAIGRIRVASGADIAVAAVTFVGAVMCAAYYASNDGTNDKDDDDDDRRNSPSRAIPRPFRAGMPGTILQIPFLLGEGHGTRAVALCKRLLIRRLSVWSWRCGRAAIAAFV